MGIQITHWIIAQGLAFLLLMVILNKILYKPVLTHIARRDADIDAKREEASLIAQKADELSKKYKQQLSVAEENSKTAYTKTLEEVHVQAEQIKQNAKEEAEAILQKKSKNLWKDIENEKAQIEPQAYLLAEKIIMLMETK